MFYNFKKGSTDDHALCPIENASAQKRSSSHQFIHLREKNLYVSCGCALLVGKTTCFHAVNNTFMGLFRRNIVDGNTLRTIQSICLALNCMLIHQQIDFGFRVQY